MSESQFNLAENMKVYQYSREVPKEAQKQFNNGRFSGTDINPQWRILKLTEMYGPAGIGWYTEPLSIRQERIDDNNVFAFVDINLYVRDGDGWSKPIFGTGGNVLVRKGVGSDEAYKMAYTDALSVACKALGIGANIYFDKDKTKYTQYAVDDGQTDAKPARDFRAEAKASSEKSDPKPTPKPDSIAGPDTTPQDGEVTQDMLTECINQRALNKDKATQRELMAQIKKLNNGSNNYRNVADPAVRKALYDWFTENVNPF